MISLQVAEPTSPVILLEDPHEIGQGSSDVSSWGHLPLIQQKRIHWRDRERNRRTGDESPERAGTGPLGGWWRRAGGSPPGGLAQHPFGRGGRGTEPRSRHVRSARPALCRAGGWGGGGGDIPPGHCPVGRGGVPVQNWGAVSKRRAHATCHAISHSALWGLCQDGTRSRCPLSALRAYDGQSPSPRAQSQRLCVGGLSPTLSS